MFQKSSCTSLSVRVIQRAVTFQKGSVNIVLQQNLPSVPKTNDPQPSTSSEIQLQKKKWAAAYYTHPNSYYKLATSHAVSLPSIKIPKPTSQEITRNEEAEMRAWAKMHG